MIYLQKFIWELDGQLTGIGCVIFLSKNLFLPFKIFILASDRTPKLLEEEQPEKLSLALEPESTAIFCQKMSHQQLAPYCQVDAASSYIIVDIGGGTVDISAHCLARNPQTHIRVIHPPTGNDYGGSRVNREFRVFLETMVSDNGFKHFLSTSDDAKNTAHLNELLKATCRGGQDSLEHRPACDKKS